MTRVVQWATGPVGRHAVAGLVDHPDHELVGGFVYDPAKVGRDLGEIAGVGTIGVVATGDRQAILDLDADCVLYMAQGDANPAPAIEDICALLASGKSVISTAVTQLIYPRSMGEEVVDRLEAACRTGAATFHATGIEPGWASEVLPLAISGILGRVESLTVQELLDYASYDNAFMLFDVMGFGRPPDDPTVIGRDAALLASVFTAPLLLVAEGLGATVERFTFDRQVSVAPAAFEVAAGPIEPGTVEALRFGATAVVDGRPALMVEHVTRLRPEAAPDWPTGRGWKVTIEGRPSMVVEAKIATHGEDENDQGCLATAMHAIHAVGPVVDAPPGIATFLDLPAIAGRHILRR